MAGICVTLDGALTIQRQDTSCPPNNVAPQTFNLALLESPLTGISGSSGSEISQGCMNISSPAAFVTLAFPGTLLARVFYLKAIGNNDGPFDVRLTHAVAGAVTYFDQYLLLTQMDSTEEISMVEVQGSGSFEWAAVGVLS